MHSVYVTYNVYYYLSIRLHLTKTFCRKCLCLIVPWISSCFVNLTSSCSLIPWIGSLAWSLSLRLHPLPVFWNTASRQRMTRSEMWAVLSPSPELSRVWLTPLLGQPSAHAASFIQPLLSWDVFTGMNGPSISQRLILSLSDECSFVCGTYSTCFFFQLFKNVSVYKQGATKQKQKLIRFLRGSGVSK